MDCGYKAGGPYDGCYVFKNVGDISERIYNACLQHLEEMKGKAEEMKGKAEGFFK